MRPIHHTKDTVMILDDISELTTPAEGPVVSLYLPTEYKRLRSLLVRKRLYSVGR